MHSILTIDGVCEHLVYKWVILALHRYALHPSDIEEKEGGLVIQVAGQQESMYDCYNDLKSQIQHAEADLKLELTSY